MMRQNFYSEFALLYDELMNDVDYGKWTSFILSHISADSKNILEAACGTGSVTYGLAQKYINITAFDISENMLIKAYEKLRRFKNVRLLNQNMVNFNMSLVFDACICCCDALNYLKISDVSLFFDRVYKHLNKDAEFIFDISTEYKYNSMDDIYVFDEENVFYVWENNLDSSSNTMSMEINFFVKKDNSYNRITELQTHYIHRIPDITQLLVQAGFTDIKVYDGYTEIDLNDKSVRAAFVCKKGEKQ